MKRVVFVVVALLIPISCFGQASLAVYSGDKLIGWLLSPMVNSDETYYLTPTGHILSLGLEGNIRVSTNILGFTDAACEGQPYVGYSEIYSGQIVRFLGSDNLDARFLKVEHVVEKAELSSWYELTESGCALNENLKRFFPASFINPAEYGIQFLNDNWRVQIDSTVVNRPDGLFCNGFESCPTQ